MTHDERHADGGGTGATPEDGWLTELARSYNEPPETPREAIWAAVHREIGDDGGAEVIPLHGNGAGSARRRVGLPGWVGLAVAAGLVLALGVGLGRMTAPTPVDGVPDVPGAALAEGTGAEEAGISTAARANALAHLGRTESLLTMVRSDARAGRYDAEVGRWARDLLLETRLLMDSPAGTDPVVSALLSDLELILAQVAVLAPGESLDPQRARSELDLIAQGLEDRDVLSRIQAVVPDGSGLLGS